LPYPAATRTIERISPEEGSYSNRVPKIWSGGDDPLEGRLDDLLGGGRDHVEREAVALDPLLQQAYEQLDVLLEADALPDLHQVLAPHAAVIRVVPQQIRELPALLDEVGAREACDLFTKPGDSHDLAEDDPRIVEAQRLVEIACEQIFLRHHLGCLLTLIPHTTTPPRCYIKAWGRSQRRCALPELLHHPT